MPNFLYFHIYCWNTTPAERLTQLNSTWVVTPPPHKHLSDELQIWGKARSRSYQGKIIARWKTTFDGRHPLMEDVLWWKTNFDGKLPLMEDDLWWWLTALLGPYFCINFAPFENWGRFASFQLNNFGVSSRNMHHFGDFWPQFASFLPHFRLQFRSTGSVSRSLFLLTDNL